MLEFIVVMLLLLWADWRLSLPESKSSIEAGIKRRAEKARKKRERNSPELNKKIKEIHALVRRKFQEQAQNPSWGMRLKALVWNNTPRINL